jgi:hypothetical protein
MKFLIKMTDGATQWVEDHDDPFVKSNVDAFLYGKVLCEYWNADLRHDEVPRRVLVGQVVGPGRKRLKRENPKQTDFFNGPGRLQ